MTATERLRALLDERGVEWWPMHDDEAGYRDDRDTEFLVYGCKHVAHEWGCRLQVDMLTPEQAIAATLETPISADLRTALDFMRIWITDDAHLGESTISYEFEKAEGLRKLDAIESAIAATLGRGTCHMRLAYEEEDADGIIWPDHYECGACGANVNGIMPYYDTEIPPKFCPNCGRRVEGGAE